MSFYTKLLRSSYKIKEEFFGFDQDLFQEWNIRSQWLRHGQENSMSWALCHGLPNPGQREFCQGRAGHPWSHRMQGAYFSLYITFFFLQKILLSSATLKLWLKLSVLFSFSRKYTYNRTYTTICIHAERTLIIVKFIN